MMPARELRVVVRNPRTRDDVQMDRAFRDLSVFMFGFFAGILAVAFFAS